MGWTIRARHKPEKGSYLFRLFYLEFERKKGVSMKYIVIAEDANQLRIEFAQQKEEVIFSTYEEAQAFIKSVHEENVLPDKYRLKIEPYDKAAEHMSQKEQE